MNYLNVPTIDSFWAKCLTHLKASLLGLSTRQTLRLLTRFEVNHLGLKINETNIKITRKLNR
jgi:hypothetical protein